jgi:nitroreductase
MNQDIINAINTAQRAQRNYDLSKSIPKDDLETLIYAAANSPSKQNETHYSLAVYTNQDMIRQIYNHTKKFLLIKDQSDIKTAFGEKDGVYWQNDDQSVTNSQILSNVLFCYIIENGRARGGTHAVGQKNPNGNAATIYNEQQSYSIGISVGQLILAANLLGYKTGICSALDSRPIKKIIGTENSVKLLVGVGYPNIDTDRRLHAETLNSDVAEKFRTGEPNENWRFPSFTKYTKVTINGNENT